jgi:DNA sulfur modification protein DndB
MEQAYLFPAIRGVQAGREYFVSMCPLRIIPQIFLFDEEELSAEMRAQRTLNQNRVPEMARYILKNQDDYVFSALTASIDTAPVEGSITFNALDDNERSVQRMGQLRIPMACRFVVNDGQHRRAAIEVALREKPSLGSETISVVFFIDEGLERSQQMFADLNRNAVRPSKSLGVLYDHRDELARMTRLAVFSSDFLKPLVELERTSLSLRSRKLFTLSSLHNANKVLIDGWESDSIEDLAEQVVEYWEAVAEHIEDWQRVHSNEMTSGDVRRNYLHSHSLSLEALANVGNHLLSEHPESWRERLEGLRKVNWERANAAEWEGRALNGGSVVKSRSNVILTTALIKRYLGLSLSEKEEAAESALKQEEDANE